MNKHFDIIRPSGVTKHKTTRTKKIILIVGIVVVIIVAGLFVWMQRSNSSTAYIQGDKYQALFLTNSQVYFGKLQRLNDASYRMTDVYYLKSDGIPLGDAAKQSTADPAVQQSSAQPTLVKLGDELHGPTDEIVIRDEQVLFWENLKTDGKVTKAIDAYKKK